MRLILLGPPGAGKGAQAELLVKKLGIPQISTGEILRDAVRNATLVGRKAKAFMEAGDLVPDDVVIGVVKDRLAAKDCGEGYILDGMPRTAAQAEALDRQGIAVDVVLSMQVPDRQILGRLAGRRTCPACAATYHIVTKPPLAPGLCDICGAKLATREDDAEETIINRLQTYHKETEPLRAYYEAQGKLRTVNGEYSAEETASAVLKSLGI